jgi:hypothetical protein
MTKRLFYGFASAALAAACLYAQSPITAQIPFAFHVGDSIFPAGSYTASTNTSGSAVLRLRAADGKATAMVLSNGLNWPGAPTQPRFVFNKYGDEYYLSQVWTTPDGNGRQLVQSRREAELAAAIKRSLQSVVARR